MTDEAAKAVTTTTKFMVVINFHSDVISPTDGAATIPLVQKVIELFTGESEDVVLT